MIRESGRAVGPRGATWPENEIVAADGVAEHDEHEASLSDDVRHEMRFRAFPTSTTGWTVAYAAPHLLLASLGKKILHSNAAVVRTLTLRRPMPV